MAIGDRISFRNKSKTDILINKNKEDLDVVEDALAGSFDPDAVTDFAGTVKVKGVEVATENYVNTMIASAGTGDNNVDMTRTFSFVGDGTEKTFAFPFIGNSVAVFIEGIKVPTSEYTLNTNADTGAGESITLNIAPNEDDIISALAFGGADVYNKTQIETLFLNKTDAENNYISKNNTTEYSPSSDYEPATKKYVDAMASSGGGNVEITKNFRHVATDKQREFSAEYILGSLNVFVNGIQLDTDEYDAADGSADNGKIVLKDEDGVPEGTVVIIVAYGGADVYNKSQADTLVQSSVDALNIKNVDGVIQNKDGVELNKVTLPQITITDRLMKKDFVTYCNGGSTIRLATILNPHASMLITATVAWTTLYSYADETGHGTGLWMASLRQDDDDPANLHAINKIEISTNGNHPPEDLFFDGYELKFTTPGSVNCVLDVSITVRDAEIGE